ncbi:MAG TPA: lysoplasmalogenase [Clostridia bacterium]|nr:lysoplasmalogenase [Clostridia bacterium]
MKALLLISVIAELIFVGFYIFSPLIKGGNKPLVAKTICAVTFVVIGVIAAFASGGYNTAYAVLISLGAAFGAFGDYALNMNTKSRRFLIGLVGFLIGHIFYASAFASMLIKISVLLLPQIFLLGLSVITVSLIIVAMGINLKVSLDKNLIPVLIYVLTISTMLVFAVAIAISMVKIEGIKSLSAALLIALGAMLFVVSDAVLAIKTFSKKTVNINRVVNPITYFSAQVMLGLSIYFVQFLTV